MLANLFKHKLRLVLLGAAVIGPVIAIVGWIEIARTNHVMAKGIVAEARLLHATRRTSRRGLTRYAIDIAWSDRAGGRRNADDVEVSGPMAERLFRDDRIVVGSVGIRYLAGETGKRSVVLTDDVAEQLSDDRMMVYAGAAVGLVAIPATLWSFGVLGWLARPRRRAAEAFGPDGRAVLEPRP